MIGIHSAEIARKPGFLTMPFCEGERRMSGRSYRRPQTFLHLGFPSKWETFRIRNPRCTYTSATDLAAVPPEKERPQNVAVDERLQGFPAPLDREIVRMAIPSLATVIMDPLLGAVDTAIMGHLGGPVLAGVGLGNILCGSTNWVFGFLSVLTIPAVAKYMAQGRKDKACEHIGQGFWVALLVGTSTMMTLLINCPQLVHVIGGEPEMMGHAIDYIRCRCLGNPFALSNFVMIGTFRAIKDARTPLYAAVLANFSNLAMDILFVYGLGMGAGGAALATSLSQVLSCAILFNILDPLGPMWWSATFCYHALPFVLDSRSPVIYRKFITWGAIKQGPKWSILGPFLKQGMAVSLRTVAVVGVIMASTSVLARVNAVSQAAHEIIRQVWILLVQFVECVNISNQAIVASAFGSKDLKYALEIVKRHMAYAVIIVSTATLTLMFFKLPLLRCFTGDAAVVGMAARVFPLVALSFPFDAITSVLDGTLTAAGQATWTARSTTFVSLAVLVALLSVERVMTMSLLKVWVFLKLITFSRLPILLHRVFRSTHSPFRGSLVVEQTRALTIEKNSAEESAAQNHGAAHEGSIGTQPEGAECAQSS